MNSGCLLELPAAPPQPADLPAPDKSRKNGEAAKPFDSVLDQVAEESAAAEETAPRLADDVEGDEKEKPEDQIAACAFGLISFCPPPEPIEAPPPAPAGLELNAALPEISSAPTEESSEPKKPQADGATADAPLLTEPLADLVRPQAAKTEKTDKTSKKDGIALDPKVFKTVEEAAVELETSGGGTVAAEQELQMKNVEKKAEIAPPIEQKAPMRDFFRRPAPEPARAESIAFLGQPDFAPNSDFELGQTVEIAPVKSLEVTHLVEGIRTEVSKLRQLGDSSMSVVLRPASGGAVTVNLTIASDGTVNAQARCDRPEDFKNLSVQWTQLQQSLGAQGIRMADLSNPGHSNQQGGQQGTPQNFHREQNPQQPRRDPNAPSFEDELAGTNPRFGAAKTFQPAGAGSTRRWQSWA